MVFKAPEYKRPGSFLDFSFFVFSIAERRGGGSRQTPLGSSSEGIVKLSETITALPLLFLAALNLFILFMRGYDSCLVDPIFIDPRLHLAYFLFEVSLI